MANIGVSRASFVTDVSVSKFAREVETSSQKLATGKTNVLTGNQMAADVMADKFKMDIGRISAAVKSMALTQGYLSATISVLDNASDLLSRIQELAVLAANSTNTTSDLNALDFEAELLADQFHKLVSEAQYKGIKIFQEASNSLIMSLGGSAGALKFGVRLEYDDFFDYTNAPLDVTEPGVTYEVISPLTDAEKAAIISQTLGLQNDDLNVGSVFTTIGTKHNSASEINVSDLFYSDGDGAVTLDDLATANSGEIFSGGSLEVVFTDNGEPSDDLTLRSGDGSPGSVVINGDAISYVNESKQLIEIGTISSNGQDGTKLEIDFHETQSGTFLNGSFDTWPDNWNLVGPVVNGDNAGQRINFGESFELNGDTIPTPSDADMQAFRAISSTNPVNDPVEQAPAATDDAAAVVSEYISSYTNYDKSGDAYFSLSTGNGNPAASISFTNEVGGILHGPAIVSDPNFLQEGDVLKMDYRTNIFNGNNDWYHVAAYLVDENNEITMMLGEYGKTTDGWRTAAVEVEKAGNYRLVVVNGTWDQNQDGIAGADLGIDNVRVETPLNINDEVIQSILRSVTYESSQDNQEDIKELTIKLETKDAVVFSDNSQIFNVLTSNFSGKLMEASSLNLENPVSLGASNELGVDGKTDTSVVTSSIERVQAEINNARALVGSKYTVLENSIDTATDLRTQFALASGTMSDVNFSLESAYLAKKQIMEDTAAAILAQSNRAQEGLLILV